MDISAILDEVIVNMTNDIYNRIRDTDSEFDTQAKQLAKLSEVKKSISNKLTPAEYADYEVLVNLNQNLQLRIQKECYIQGAKDCVILLRNLGVI